MTLGVGEAARSLGLGIEVVLAVDTNADAVAVYNANLPGANVRRVRVEELFDGAVGAPLTDTEHEMKLQVGEVDVLVGGPPCQGHSDLNNRTRRDDPRNALYVRMARAAEVLEPKLVLIENVPTVTHDVEKVVEETVRAFKTIRYSVAEAVIDISRLGAPQRRRRHVVLASRRSEVSVGDIVSKLEQRCPQHAVRTVRWAIEDLKSTKSAEMFDSASVPSPGNVQRIAWLFEHRKYNLPNTERPVCHRSDHSYNAMYGRLQWDQPAQTVTTGFGSMGQGRYVHPSKRRTISPHEAARLQMLPDFWSFRGVKTRGALARLIGNAVPPVLAAALMEPALRSIGLGPVDALPVIEASKSRKPNRSPRDPERRQTRRAGVPTPSSAAALRRMKATRQRDTAPELALRTQLYRNGLRYTVDRRVDGTNRRADIVFKGSRVVVFVDGCFWHSCPQHATVPKKNRNWWVAKLAANSERDRDTDDRLRKAGWTILRFWEHEEPSVAAAQVRVAVADARLRLLTPGASADGRTGGGPNARRSE